MYTRSSGLSNRKEKEDELGGYWNQEKDLRSGMSNWVNVSKPIASRPKADFAGGQWGEQLNRLLGTPVSSGNGGGGSQGQVQDQSSGGYPWGARAAMLCRGDPNSVQNRGMNLNHSRTERIHANGEQPWGERVDVRFNKAPVYNGRHLEYQNSMESVEQDGGMNNGGHNSYQQAQQFEVENWKNVPSGQLLAHVNSFAQTVIASSSNNQKTSNAGVQSHILGGPLLADLNSRGASTREIQRNENVDTQSQIPSGSLLAAINSDSIGFVASRNRIQRNDHLGAQTQFSTATNLVYGAPLATNGIPRNDNVGSRSQVSCAPPSTAANPGSLTPLASASEIQRNENVCMQSQCPSGSLPAAINSSFHAPAALIRRIQRTVNADSSQMNDHQQKLAALFLANHNSKASSNASQRNMYAPTPQIYSGNGNSTNGYAEQHPQSGNRSQTNGYAAHHQSGSRSQINGYAAHHPIYSGNGSQTNDYAESLQIYSGEGNQKSDYAVNPPIYSGNESHRNDYAGQPQIHSGNGSQTFNYTAYSQNHSGNQHISTANDLHINREYPHDPNWIKSNNYQHKIQDGCPVPYHPASTFDINSGNISMSEAISGRTISFQCAPITPEKDSNFQQLNGASIGLQRQERSLPEAVSSQNSFQFVPETSEKERNVQQQCPEKSMADTVSSNTSFQFAPVTPLKDSNVEQQSNSPIYLENVRKPNQEIADVVNLNLEEPRVSPGVNQENNTNLNETPSNKEKKKKPRKYTPKVVLEGPPKRPPKATPKPKENLKPKRAYVRRKGVNPLNTPLAEGEKSINATNSSAAKSCKHVINFDSCGQEKDERQGMSPTTQVEEVINPTGTPAPKSCKRNINFDLYGEERDERQGTSSSSVVAYNFDIQRQEQVLCNARTDTSSGTRSTFQFPRGLEVDIEHTKGGFAFDLNQSNTQVLDEYMSSPAMIEQLTRKDLFRRNIKELAREKDIIEKRERVNYHNHSVTTMQNISNCSQGVQPIPLGSKRGNYSDEKRLLSMNIMGAHFNSLQAYQDAWKDSNGSDRGLDFSEIYKRRKTMTVHDAGMSNTSPLENMSQFQQQTKNSGTSPHCNNTNGLQNLKDGLRNVYSKPMEPVNNSRVQKSPAEMPSQIVTVRENAVKPQLSPQFLLNFNHMRSTEVIDLTSNPSPAPCIKVHTEPRIGSEPGFRTSQEPQSHLEVTRSVRNAKKAKMNRNNKQLALAGNASFPNGNEITQQGQDTGRSSGRPRGRPKGVRQSFTSIDDIIQKMSCVTINNTITTLPEHNAIVPYGVDSKMVPYEDHTKKRHERPRVMVDQETERKWKLIMGPGGNIDVDTPETAEYWEGQKQLYKKRADAFITIMNDIQGDRTFTKWNGSVLDSIVGVFLTQNVSDHLSSSAFMCMAAHFPLKRFNEPVQIIVEHPDDEICQQKANADSDCDQSTITLQEVENAKERVIHNNVGSGPSGDDMSRESPQSTTEILGAGNVVSSLAQTVDIAAVYLVSSQTSNASSQVSIETRIERDSFAEGEDVRAPEDIISSQYSAGSSSPQPDERIRSCSGSNSEGEDPSSTAACESNSFSGHTSFTRLLLTAGTAEWAQYYDPMFMNSGIDLNSMSPLPTTLQPDIPSKISSTHVKPNLKMHEEGHLKTWEESTLKLSLGQEDCNEKQPQTCNKQQGNAPFEMRKQVVEQGHSCFPNFSKGTPDVGETTKPAGNKASKPNVGKQSSASDKTPSAIIDSEKAKAKLEKENKKPVDWDQLRKATCQNKKQRERGRYTKDSLDWEAVRNAEVSEIANTIKERGMNNMLAVRIKEFLNRMLREHESLDLEWLRDVPAAQAKDFLLSVRGLGIKSVECIRLLALDHIAFPVDTNVGRIAVRLGWVELRPLPDSVHLHLLEMYPVQEHIQKYLWTRLCHLDHSTLYKLHYHLITFGKVFCTKSKPNCNACPMRAECKHFASAFASSRLHLPAPEEKRVLKSGDPYTPTEVPMGNVKPMSVPLLEGTFRIPSQITNANINPVPSPRPGENVSTHNKIPVADINIEPVLLSEDSVKPAAEISSGVVTHPDDDEVAVIDYPSSPEQTEAAELEEREEQIRDIEDAFYNDPEEEIPTINISTIQLRNTIEEIIGCSLPDNMSNALVPFKTDVTIPTTKLKNISRLRTEHLVYELPDWHHLLIGMERRVENEPGKYLLAIWTPGETADSAEPSKATCDSEPGKLCNVETCVPCNAVKEANSGTVRGTILIPSKTAMRGSFPLNGTYFQVNEVFADHASSKNPIDVPRISIWNLPRKTVLFGTSIPSIFKGQTMEEIQRCFWRGYVCVRGFDQVTRAPKPLIARLHLTASRLTGNKTKRSDRE